MGAEAGKLMDLNQFAWEARSFPVKSGNLSILPKVKYVITLDSDTELLRGAAQRMVGAIIYPLNQAIVDPQDNIVVAGNGSCSLGWTSAWTARRDRVWSEFRGETGLGPL